MIARYINPVRPEPVEGSEHHSRIPFASRPVLRYRRISKYALIFFSAFLTACSLPPSEGDIKAAIEASLTDTNKLTSSLFGDAGKVEIVAVNKIGCSKDGGGYLCDVEVTTKVPVVGETKKESKMRFVKLDSGWSVAQ